MRQGYSQRRTDSLDYMQSMLGQLRTMAEAERLEMVAYLLEMAYVEVGDIIRGERPLRVRSAEGDRTAGMPLQTPRKVKFQ